MEQDTRKLPSDNDWHHHISLLKIKNLKNFGILRDHRFRNYISECWFHRWLWWLGFFFSFFLLLFCAMFAFSINCAHVSTAHDDLFNWPPTLNSIHFTFFLILDTERYWEVFWARVNGTIFSWIMWFLPYKELLWIIWIIFHRIFFFQIFVRKFPLKMVLIRWRFGMIKLVDH